MIFDIGQQIARLYREGFSVRQISESLNISSSKVRSSLKAQSVERRDISTAIKMLNVTQFGKKQCEIKRNLSRDEELLRTAGIMLYWGEGTKSGNSVVFCNSDPYMIKMFLRFLRDICRVDESRLRILLHLYTGQVEEKIKAFWFEITGIPEKQFSKTHFHTKKKGTYKKFSNYGTVSLRYSDTELLNNINKWIDDFKRPA